MIDLLKNAWNLFVNSYLYLVLSVFYFILLSFFQSRDKKDQFNPKLLVLVVFFSYIVNAYYVITEQTFSLDIVTWGIIIFYVISFLFFFVRDTILAKHESVSKLTITLILSVILIFTVSSLFPLYYLLICGLIIFFMLISYSYKKNVKLFLYGSILLLSNLFLFLLKNWSSVKKFEINSISISFLIYFTVLLK